MPEQRFSLEFDKPPRLEISWEGGWFRVANNIIIACDSVLLGHFKNRADLEKEQEFQLKDGSLLKIQLISNRFMIFYNGHSVWEIAEAMKLRFFSFMAGCAFALYGLWSIFYNNTSPSAITSYFGIGLGCFLNGLLVKKTYSVSAWGLIFLYSVYATMVVVVIPIQENIFPKNLSHDIFFVLLQTCTLVVMFPSLLRLKMRNKTAA